MTSTGKRVGLNVLRSCTFGLSEIGLKGKRISHSIGPDYVLEWLGENMLRAGSYCCESPIDGSKTYSPSNMTLSDLRQLMNYYPGSGDCKDHVNFWWEKIKQRY